MTTGQKETLPLTGITVVEIGHSLSAPYATYILASLGAEVLKIENPGAGDYARGWGKVRSGDAAVMFHSINNGKKSIIANLRDLEVRADLKRLIVDRADVVVQNLKPGTAEKLGLGAEELRAQKPELVYCEIGAFGGKGPLKDSPGYDPIAQAASGMMSLVGHPGDRTSRVPVSINDIGSGMWSAIGILSALYKRTETGKGTTVATSLYETAMSWMVVQMTDYLNSGEEPTRQGSANANIVPYQVFQTKDGEMLIAAGNDRLFAAFAETVDRADLIEDPRFVTGSDRAANVAALIPELEKATSTSRTKDLSAELKARGVPCEAIHNVPSAADAEQTHALGLVMQTPVDGVKTIGLPLSMNNSRIPLAGKSPKLGEQSDILKEQRYESYND